MWKDYVQKDMKISTDVMWKALFVLYALYLLYNPVLEVYLLLYLSVIFRVCSLFAMPQPH